MTTPHSTSAAPLDANSDLHDVLAAWHTATLRLERTHETLRGEVQRLTDELEVKNRELARKNRLADLGQLASHVAHEVRNNLVPVTLYLSLLRRRLTADSASLELLTKIETGCGALEACVSDLLNFAADREPQRRDVQVAPLAEEILASLAPQLVSQNIAAECTIPATLQLHVDPAMLRSALLNLALNALDAMPDGGALQMTAVERDGLVSLDVADSGAGLPPELARRVFEPFFTTKSSGTGLGLAVVERVAEAHGGRVACENAPEGGACFRLEFPRHDAANSSSSSHHEAAA